MPLVIATSNAGKLHEFRRLLPVEIRLMTLADVNIDLPPECGETYAANALIKAWRQLSLATPRWPTTQDLRQMRSMVYRVYARHDTLGSAPLMR